MRLRGAWEQATRLAHLSTAPPKPLREGRYLDNDIRMNADRIETALQRIEAAVARINAARETAAAGETKAAAGSARVVELVNAHEKLREQVADSLRELDEVLAKLEDEQG